MKNEQTFHNLIAALELRSEAVSVAAQLGLSKTHAYEYGYMQSMVYQMALMVPGVEEFLEQELRLVNKLNLVEGITSELAVPHEII